MKKNLILVLVLFAYSLNAQVLSTSDAAVLFSSSGDYGTSRYNAMSGAFGALGGDLSGSEINPAGLAVFSSSQASTTASYRDVKTTSNFYGTSTPNQDSFLKLSQIGSVFVFNDINSPVISKVAIGFNYSIINDFDDSYAIKGNSGTPDFEDDPFLNSDNNPFNDIYYTNVDGQSLTNITSGLSDKFTFNLATEYNKRIYFGVSLTSYDLNFFQNAHLNEYDSDGASNTLDASLVQQLHTNGNGFSFGLGVISKLTKEIRFGLSYQSPIWYNLTDSYVEDLEIDVSNNRKTYTENSDVSVFNYRLFSPSVLTGSLAYIFKQNGLISFDYSYKNYRNVRLNPSASFTDENQYLNSDLKGVSKIKVGAEWRYKQISFRGGYFFEQSPYKNSNLSGNKDGFSLGLGIDFGRNTKIDFAYNKRTHTDSYKFLDASNPAKLNIQNSITSLSLIFGL